MHEVETCEVLTVGHEVETVGNSTGAAGVAPSVEDAFGRAAASHLSAENAAVDSDVAGVAVSQEAAHVGAAAGDVGADDAVLDEVGAAVSQ